MPYTKNGIVPDLIINSLAIPSRMTLAQLIECVMGKACAVNGYEADATPFTGLDVEQIADVLEKLGFERYGTEVMYSGMTGEQLEARIFIGPTFYYRLKHLVSDKIHCLTLDHEVLTENGWKFFKDITYEDKIATLKEGELIYDHPIELIYYPEYEGKMYKIKTQQIDLNVTINHRMFVKISNSDEYKLIKIEDILNETVKYKNIDNEIIINGKNGIIYDYKGPVFCLQVPSEVFYVRRNGIPVWTGNSRSSGPYQLLTKQPAEGRSRAGGLRCGKHPFCRQKQYEKILLVCIFIYKRHN